MEGVVRADYSQIPGKISSSSGFFGGIKAKFDLSDDQKALVEEEFSFYGEIFSEVYNIGSHFYSAYQAGTPLPQKIANTAKLIEEAFKQFLIDHPKVDQALKGLELVSALSLPSSLYSAGIAIRDFSQGDLPKKIESAFDLLYEAATIGTCISEVAQGLSAIGKVAEKSIWWAAPLAIFSTGLYITKPFKTGYQWWQNYQFLKDFTRNSGLDKQGEYLLKDAENALVYLKSKDDDFLETHCGEDGTKLKNRIEKISKVAKRKLKTGKAEDAKEAQKQLKDSMEDLRKRISSANTSFKVSMASNSLEFIGYCLYLAPPLAPVGEALVTASTVVESGSDWHHSRMFLKDFNAISGLSQKEPSTVQGFDKAIEFIRSKDDSSLKKLFKVKGEKLKHVAEKVSKLAKAKLASGNAEKIKEGEKELKEFIELLKGRVENGQLSHQLSVLSGSVSIVGLGVIMAPPIAPVGYGLLIAGSGISIGKLIFTKVIESRFEKVIESMADKDISSNQAPFAFVVNELKKRDKG